MNDEHHDLIEARGQGAELFDAPSRFFLTHRESIETWYALRRPATAAVDRYLLTLAEPLEELSDAFGWQFQSFEYGSNYRALAVAASDEEPCRTRGPSMLVGIEWRAVAVGVDDTATAPVVGVRISSTHDDGLRQRFLDAGQPAAKLVRERDNYDKNSWWAMFTRSVGDPAWWNDLDGYRNQTVNTLRGLLEQVRPAIEAVLKPR